MIFGIGTDIVDIKRIEKLLNDNGERFITRTFTEFERKAAEKRENGGTHINAYAKRFAAKEALAKALGTGFRDGIIMKDIEVINDKNGAPTIKLHNTAQIHLESITPEHHKPKIHLSLSDDANIAQAFVVIEMRATGTE